MKEIDFLPTRYREGDARRRAGLWRFGLVLMLGGVVVAASLGQFAYRAKVQGQLVEIQPLLAQAHATEAHAAQLKTELHQATRTANLYAVVQTPWPKTQVIAAVVAPLDESIVIREIHHRRRENRTAGQRAARVEFQLSGKDEAAQKSATDSDLDMIRTQLYEARESLQIVGETNDQAKLHDFLERLDAAPLFESVELIEVDTVAGEVSGTRLRFTARVVVRPPLGASDAPDSAQLDDKANDRLAG